MGKDEKTQNEQKLDEFLESKQREGQPDEGRPPMPSLRDVVFGRKK